MRTRVKTTGLAPLTEGRRRGRPRSAAAREAILRAARDMLADVGPSSVTVEGIATRAGVGKPTIYRWWSDRHAVVMAALMDVEADAPARAGRSPLTQLRQQLHAIAERFATPTGRHVTAMLAAADPNSELSKAFRNHFVMARRAEGAAFLRAAIQSGELGRLDIDVALDLLFGAVFFRLLMGHAPLDSKFIDNMFELALCGVRRGTSQQRNTKARRR
jgi:AcrR family transcriptional regulator